jgi:hypothetical protein
MKHNIKLIALTAIIAVLLIVGIKSSNYYTRRDCRVMWNRNGIVCVQDIFGNLWEFEGTGFKPDEYIDIVMHNNNTHNTQTDDKVIDVRK